MNVQKLQVAGLSYAVSSQVKLGDNYKPFVREVQENDSFTSVVSVGDISVTVKDLCHKGLVIDDTKELYIYRRNDNGYYVTLRMKGQKEVYELSASSKWNNVVLSINCASNDCHPSVIDIFMMLTFIYSAAYSNIVLLHASCVKCGNEAVAFIGQSGAGKSTHSQLWLEYIPNAILLNDDQPAVRVYGDGEVRIFGTPWSGKTLCYKFDSGELKGIIRMKQASFNKITKLGNIQLFQELLSSSSMIKADPVTFKLITSTLAKLAAAIPGFKLENRPEKEAVMLSYSHTINNALINNIV